ncbi:uncharacterized protein ACO6RY_03157 [Pungitius sinensis]
MRVRGNGSVHLVATWDHRWTPGPDYRDRMTANETVIFNDANLNDEGLYELTCATGTHRFHLHVFVSTTYTVTEGDSVSFECYAKTERELGHFTVQRGREPVFGLDYRSGNQSPGAGFQGRVSVPPQWKTTGNLTMTLKGATTGDEGVYWFYVQHEDTSGLKEKLGAVRLKVNKRVPDPTPRSPPTSSPTEQNVETPWKAATVVLAVVLAVVLIVVLIVVLAVVLAVVLVAVLVAGFFLYRKHHRHRRPQASPGSPDEVISLQPRANGGTLVV